MISATPTAPPQLLLTVREAALALAISERSLFALTKSGHIPAVRLGKRAVRYSPEDLQAFIQRAKTTAAPSGHTEVQP